MDINTLRNCQIHHHTRDCSNDSLKYDYMLTIQKDNEDM